jgi:hypothetical protein
MWEFMTWQLTTFPPDSQYHPHVPPVHPFLSKHSLRKKGRLASQKMKQEAQREKKSQPHRHTINIQFQDPQCKKVMSCTLSSHIQQNLNQTNSVSCLVWVACKKHVPVHSQYMYGWYTWAQLNIYNAQTCMLVTVKRSNTSSWTLVCDMLTAWLLC